MMFNINRFFKRAQVGRGLWVGIDPLIFMLRNHPRRRDVHEVTHRQIEGGTFGGFGRGGQSHGIVTWHAADMSPRIVIDISMPDDDTLVIDNMRQKLQPSVTREELHEAGKELVEKLSGHSIRLAGSHLRDGRSTGDHIRWVRALGIAD